MRRGVASWDASCAGGRRVEHREVVAAVLGVAHEQTAVVEEHVALQAEDPGHARELGGARGERAGLGPAGVARLTGRDRVQVPPAGAVAGEPERAVRAPERLQDRLVRAAGDEPLAGDAAVAGELRRPQLGAVPRHARVVPREPGETAPVRADARRGVEVVAGGDDARLGRSVGGQAHQLVDHLAVGLVPLAHAHEQAAVGRDAPVGVAVGARGRRSGRDRARGAPGGRRGSPAGPRPRRLLAGRPQVLPVQALVGLVAEDDALVAVLAAEGDVHAAAVLVHERPGADAGGRDVGDLAVRRPPDDHVAAVLQRAQLGPVQALAHALRPHRAHAALGDEPRRHRGAPRAVGRDRTPVGRPRALRVSTFVHRSSSQQTERRGGLASRRASACCPARGVSGGGRTSSAAPRARRARPVAPSAPPTRARPRNRVSAPAHLTVIVNARDVPAVHRLLPENLARSVCVPLGRLVKPSPSTILTVL